VLDAAQHEKHGPNDVGDVIPVDSQRLEQKIEALLIM
jgi:hypothetical protein